MQVAAAPDDHILDPTGDVNIGVGHIAEVSGVEPVVVKQRTGGLRVVEVAGGR